MLSETYPAAWSVLFPRLCDPSAVWEILTGFLMCNWSPEAFIWDLPELHRLLTVMPAEHDYLFVTRHMQARAAFLSMNGPFATSALEVVQGIARHRFQFAAAYRFLTLRELDAALKERAKRPAVHRSEDRLFAANLGRAERAFVELLQVNGLTPNPEFVCHGFTLGEWRAGRLAGDRPPRGSAIPRAVNVPVQIEENLGHRKVKPSPKELAVKLATGATVRTFREQCGQLDPIQAELERLTLVPKRSGGCLLRCGDGTIQFFRTTINDAKNTLYVVCVDRTLKLRRVDGRAPSSRPTMIHGSFVTGASGSGYLVEFDNGAIDFYTLEFRAHRENEEAAVNSGKMVNSEQAAVNSGAAENKGTQRTERTQGTSVARKVPGRKRRKGRMAKKARVARQRRRGAKKVAAKAKVVAAGTVRKAGNVPPGRGGVEKKARVVTATVVGDYMLIRLGNGREINLAKKPKARAVVKFILKRAQEKGEREFTLEDVRKAFNARFLEGPEAKEWKSDRFREDLFKRRVGDFDVLFETVNRAAGIYRVRVTVV